MERTFNLSLFLAVFSGFIFTSQVSAQYKMKERLKWNIPIPDSIVWNLSKEEVFVGNPTGFGDIPESVWDKPSQLFALLVIVKPKDLGFGDGFEHSDFILKAKDLGYLHCPFWVPVQMYMILGNGRKRVFFYTGQANKHWCFGVNEKTYRSTDLWKREPDRIADHYWVFVRPQP